MARDRIVIGIDIGTTKTCTLVGELSGDGHLSITGYGIGPSQGMRRGMVVNIDEVTAAVMKATARAERLARCKIETAYVSIAGSHIASENSRGTVTFPPGAHEITPADVQRAVESARAMPLAADREIIHLVPRGFIVDGQDGVRDPVGMAGHRLEVEAHIVTGAVATIHNLIKCVHRAGIEVDDLVLQPLASAEAVLTDVERELGVVLVDIGGGTTDVAVFIQGSIWYTAVLPLGGNNITHDLAVGLRIPTEAAEELKLTHATVHPDELGQGGTIEVESFEPGVPQTVDRRQVTEIVLARVEEILEHVAMEIKKSGYWGLIPAGVVLTGGTAELRGLPALAQRVLGMPVRVGLPRGFDGLSDTLSRPAFATSVGLVLWGAGNPVHAHPPRRVPALGTGLASVMRHIGRMLGAFAV